MKQFHDESRRGAMSPERAGEILQHAPVGFLATAQDSWPYCLPVSFVFDGDEIYIHSAIEGRKISDIEANPPVCFAVLGNYAYAAGHCDFAYESVLVFGKAWLLAEPTQKRRAYELLLQKYEPDGGFGALKDECIDNSAIIVIEIDEITGKAKEIK
jgi:nitroimidazol reductase NimA-like FMN-containing flavoprotein (pyridoxamine 5'-phosphate oxidase superfamily)